MEFRLYDNDQPQTIKVEEVISPVSLVVAIQADYKVEKVLPKIQKIGNLLENMVAGDNGEIAVVAFDHRIQKLQDFTTDPTKIVEALKKLKPGSSQSVLTDAVNEAARMLEKRPKERRRVLLLISESLDKGSEGRAREALTRLEFANVIVYALNMSRVFTELTAKTPLARPDLDSAGSAPRTCRYASDTSDGRPTYRTAWSRVSVSSRSSRKFFEV